MMSNTPPPPPSIDSICANCGKGEESSGDLKACTACKMVKYRNRECQIAHRPQHKKLCKKRAAELHDKNCLKSLHHPKSVQYACYHYQHFMPIAQQA